MKPQNYKIQTPGPAVLTKRLNVPPPDTMIKLGSGPVPRRNWWPLFGIMLILLLDAVVIVLVRRVM